MDGTVKLTLASISIISLIPMLSREAITMSAGKPKTILERELGMRGKRPRVAYIAVPKQGYQDLHR
jgi:hypothetical protein